MTPIFKDRGRPRLSIHIAIQFLTLCLVLFAARGVWAQANAGVTGTVTDSSGAVIQDANVTITNEGTSVSSKAVTSSSGTYSFTGLTPGVLHGHGGKERIQESGADPRQRRSQRHLHYQHHDDERRRHGYCPGRSKLDCLNTTAPQLGSTIEPVVVKALPTEVSGQRPAD